MNKFTFVAVDENGDYQYNFGINLDAEDGMKPDEIEEAIKKASVEFCRTETGRRIYDRNGGSFTYEDFSRYVPNDICKKYGIEKAGEHDRIIVTEPLEEQLVDEGELEELDENAVCR